MFSIKHTSQFFKTALCILHYSTQMHANANFTTSLCPSFVFVCVHSLQSLTRFPSSKILKFYKQGIHKNKVTKYKDTYRRRLFECACTTYYPEHHVSCKWQAERAAISIIIFTNNAHGKVKVATTREFRSCTLAKTSTWSACRVLLSMHSQNVRSR